MRFFLLFAVITGCLVADEVQDEASSLEPQSSKEQHEDSFFSSVVHPFIEKNDQVSSYRVSEVSGNVVLNSPRGHERIDSACDLLMLDRLKTLEKGSLVLENEGGYRFEVGPKAIVQLVKSSWGGERLRLIKGKVRVISSDQKSSNEIETMNAVVTVHHGISDVIISAMNTLVAPREGDGVEVKSKKALKRVDVGSYGLVMADGSLLFTGKGS